MTENSEDSLPESYFDPIKDAALISDDENYYHRTETKNTWDRYFTTEFEITERPPKSWDVSQNSPLKDEVYRSGKCRAFYYYKNLACAINQMKRKDRFCSEDTPGYN